MIYGYLMSHYVNTENNRFYSSAHKKSDLKKTYNEILKISKDSPSYLIKPTEENQSFALQLKETVLSLQSTLEQLQNGGDASPFSYKEVMCNHPSAVTAEIDTEDHSKLPEAFSLQIDQLATPQINAGSFVYRTSSQLREGNYSFSIDMEENQYQFQIQLGKKTPNETVLNQLRKAINRSPIDLTAHVENNASNDKVRLVLQSNQTGCVNGNPIFTCQDLDFPSSNGCVEFFGLNHIEQMPENSSFYINGEPKTTLANEFTLNNALHVQLLQPTANPVQIDFTSDTSRITTVLDSVKNSYNSLVKLSYNQGDPPHIAHLMLHDLKKLFASEQETLQECGISFDEDGYMEIDSEQITSAIRAGRLETLFGADNIVGNKALQQSQSFSLNPMKYLEEKVVVTYKDPTKQHFINPYLTSIYSGMLFQSY